MVGAHVEALKVGAVAHELTGGQFTAARRMWQAQAEAEKVRAAGTDLSNQMHRQGADDGIAGGNVCRVQVRAANISGDALCSGPLHGTGVACDEEGGHVISPIATR